MSQIASMFVKVGADVSQFTKQMDQAHKSLNGAFDVAFGVTASELLMGAFQGVSNAIGQTIGSLVEVEKIGAQTAAVLKSTGGAAGIAADEVSSLADSIERATGVEAEGIQQGENLLLTFTNIRNGVGAGNDVFNQATGIMVDMATAMGTDVKSGAIQLGKALNDPVTGVTALTRVGVTFTEEQKNQIKALSDSGKTMEAQKIILAELNKEFGGSAKAAGETFGGSLKKLENSLGNVQEAILGGSVPALKAMADFGTQAFSDLADAITAHGLIGGLMKITSPEIKAGFIGIASVISAALIPSIVTAGRQAALAALPFTPWIAAAMGIAGAAHIIIKNWGPISRFFADLWNGISDGVATLYNNFRSAFGGIETIVQTVAQFIRDKFGWVVDLLPQSMKDAIAGAGKAIGSLPGIVTTHVTGAASAINKLMPVAGNVPVMMGNMVAGTGAALAKLPATVAGPVNQAVKAVELSFNDLYARFRQIDAEAKVFGDATGAIQAKLRELEGAIKKGLNFTGPLTPAQQASLDSLIKQFHELRAALDGVSKAKGLDDAFTAKMNEIPGILNKMTADLNNASASARVWGDATGGAADKQQIIRSAIDQLIPKLGENHAIIGDLKRQYDELGQATVQVKPSFDSVKASATDVLNSITGLRDGVGRIAQAFGAELNDPVSSAIGKFADVGLSVMGIVTSAQTLWPQLVTLATNTGVVTAAQWLWNAALTANPIGVVVVAIGAAIAAIGLLAANWDTVSAFLMDSFGKVGAFFQSVFSGLGAFFAGVWDGIVGIFKGVVNGYIRIFNFLIGALNMIQFEIPGWVPGIGGQKIGVNLPMIPMLAEGGVVDRPTQAVIGEGSSPEAVLPLNDNTFQRLGAAIAEALKGQLGGGGDTWNVTFQTLAWMGDEASKQELARLLAIAMKQAKLARA